MEQKIRSEKDLWILFLSCLKTASFCYFTFAIDTVEVITFMRKAQIFIPSKDVMSYFKVLLTIKGIVLCKFIPNINVFKT